MANDIWKPKRLDFDNPQSLSDDEYRIFTSLSKSQFDDLICQIFELRVINLFLLQLLFCYASFDLVWSIFYDTRIVFCHDCMLKVWMNLSQLISENLL